MSIWTRIVSGRATSAALRGALRRCRRMRVAFLRMASPPGRTGHDDGDRTSIGVPQKCEPKIPLPAPCRAGFVPACGVKKLPARHTMRGAGSMRRALIRSGLSAISSIKSRTPLGFLENFSLSSGTARERGLRRSTAQGRGLLVEKANHRGSLQLVRIEAGAATNSQKPAQRVYQHFE
jgi:hypothetical protein